MNASHFILPSSYRFTNEHHTHAEDACNELDRLPGIFHPEHRLIEYILLSTRLAG
jgi:hypothetical protein